MQTGLLVKSACSISLWVGLGSVIGYCNRTKTQWTVLTKRYLDYDIRNGTKQHHNAHHHSPNYGATHAFWNEIWHDYQWATDFVLGRLMIENIKPVRKRLLGVNIKWLI